MADDPKCPNGCKANVARLAGSDAYQRFQCGDLDCLKTWDVPREGVKRVLPDYSNVEENMNCSKGCGKTFSAENAWKEKHEAKCDGGGDDGSVEESPDLPSPRGKRAAKSTGLNGLTEATDSMIRALEAKRDKLIQEIPELAKINSAIAALQGLKES